jgi:hypothetical protein
MSVAILFSGRDLHSVLGEDRAASLMSNTADRHAALETDSHSAQRPSRLGIYRTSKYSFAQAKDRGGDSSSVNDGHTLFVYGKPDQCV